MNRLPTLLAACLLLPAPASLRADTREEQTVAAAADTVQALSTIPFRGIPPALLRDAAGVAVIPEVFKAGFVFGGRFGRGVVLTRLPDGGWSNPVFITLAGGSFGWQAGVQSTDVVLVFKTRVGLERILRGKGKITLGGDVGVAAGPVGRQAEAATDGQLRAEIYSYSRSRGLFAGLALEGAGLLVDYGADRAFYGVPSGHPGEVLSLRGVPIPVVAEALKSELRNLTCPPLPAPPASLPPR